jgi:hypothetical protein
MGDCGLRIADCGLCDPTDRSDRSDPTDPSDPTYTAYMTYEPLAKLRFAQDFSFIFSFILNVSVSSQSNSSC